MVSVISFAAEMTFTDNGYLNKRRIVSESKFHTKHLNLSILWKDNVVVVECQRTLESLFVASHMMINKGA